MGKKIQPIYNQNGSIGLYAFYCPGCKENHAYTKDRWEYNGNDEKPTFTPSLLYPKKKIRCHLFLTEGKIQYLSDCDHELAGQTVEVPDWDDDREGAW
ncbi:DUF6527 family protein [Bacillota bacterium Lsc_1132]